MLNNLDKMKIDLINCSEEKNLPELMDLGINTILVYSTILVDMFPDIYDFVSVNDLKDMVIASDNIFNKGGEDTKSISRICEILLSSKFLLSQEQVQAAVLRAKELNG